VLPYLPTQATCHVSALEAVTAVTGYRLSTSLFLDALRAHAFFGQPAGVRARCPPRLRVGDPPGIVAIAWWRDRTRPPAPAGAMLIASALPLAEPEIVVVIPIRRLCDRRIGTVA
jgi:hypothetical protein